MKYRYNYAQYEWSKCLIREKTTHVLIYEVMLDILVSVGSIHWALGPRASSAADWGLPEMLWQTSLLRWCWQSFCPPEKGPDKDIHTIWTFSETLKHCIMWMHAKLNHLVASWGPLIGEINKLKIKLNFNSFLLKNINDLCPQGLKDIQVGSKDR